MTDAGAGDLHPVDQSRTRQRPGQPFREFARIAPQLARELQGCIGGEVAVLGLLRPVEGDGPGLERRADCPRRVGNQQSELGLDVLRRGVVHARAGQRKRAII